MTDDKTVWKTMLANWSVFLSIKASKKAVSSATRTVHSISKKRNPAANKKGTSSTHDDIKIK
jgi:hypothetical protein